MLKQVGSLPPDKKCVKAIRDCDVTKSDCTKVSVGLPVCNGTETIKRSVTRILNQISTDLTLNKANLAPLCI